MYIAPYLDIDSSFHSIFESAGSHSHSGPYFILDKCSIFLLLVLLVPSALFTLG